MGRVAATVFDVAANPRYRQHVLQWAPDIATHEPGSAGGVLGLDFHLTVDGPRLIEVNTNPGGLLLKAVLVNAVQACAPDAWNTSTTERNDSNTHIIAWLEDVRTGSEERPEGKE